MLRACTRKRTHAPGVWGRQGGWGPPLFFNSHKRTRTHMRTWGLGEAGWVGPPSFCAHTRTHARARTRTHTRTHTHTHAHAHTHVHTRTRTQAGTHPHTCTHTHARTHAHALRTTGLAQSRKRREPSGAECTSACAPERLGVRGRARVHLRGGLREGARGARRRGAPNARGAFCVRVGGTERRKEDYGQRA